MSAGSTLQQKWIRCEHLSVPHEDLEEPRV